ncbi:MAG: hypothetical protein KKD77_20920 [Gammaproteobacteria bacterium]|nr:hypothetical protein [Gammaproteobacteria bacterium]
MYTSEFVSLAQKSQAQGFDRVSDIVPLLSQVQDILYKHECPYTRYIDPATGRPPVLNTTAGIYQYSGPSNCWRVANICLKSESIDNSDYNATTLPQQNTTERTTINGNYYYPYNFGHSEDALEGASPQVFFTRDPGTKSNYYYMICYKKPTPITSDRVQLQIPDSDGAHRLIVFPCLMKLIEAQNNGNYVDAMQFIEQSRILLWQKVSGNWEGWPRKRTVSRPA